MASHQGLTTPWGAVDRTGGGVVSGGGSSDLFVKEGTCLASGFNLPYNLLPVTQPLWAPAEKLRSPLLVGAGWRGPKLSPVASLWVSFPAL